MLRVERKAGTSEIVIRTKKNRWIESRFLQAIGYSFLLHIAVCGIFRIKSLPLEEAKITNAIEVSILSEKGDEEGEPLSSALAETIEASSNKKPFFDAALLTASNKALLPEQPFLDQAACTEVALFPSQKKVFLVQPYFQKASPTLAVPISWKERFYPLDITFSSSLSSLTLIEDGSSLFKEKNSKPFFLVHIAKIPKIEYRIVVSGKTGKIESWTRKKELLDKKFQYYIDLLVQTLRFAPSKEESYEGKLWIEFACTGEEIETFLLPHVHKKQ